MQVRSSCIFCNHTKLINYFSQDMLVPQAMFLSDSICNASWMPYNVSVCQQCYTHQTKYLADINLLYSVTHIAPIGNIRKSMDDVFASMIHENSRINGILEIGGGQGTIADMVVGRYEYTIIDPAYTGSQHNRTIIKGFAEDIDISGLDANTLVMSHVFEHLYSPMTMLEKVLHPGIEYVYICHPDYDDYTEIMPLTYNILHAEHTFFIDNAFLVGIIERFGFKKISEVKHSGYAVMYAFQRDAQLASNQSMLANTKTIGNFARYVDDIQNKIRKIHDIIDTNVNIPVYIWPCSVHTLSLFYHGLDHTRIAGCLDNSTSKIGKIMYGYNVKCIAMSNAKEGIVVLNGGCYNRDILIEQKSGIQYITFE